MITEGFSLSIFFFKIILMMKFFLPAVVIATSILFISCDSSNKKTSVGSVFVNQDVVSKKQPNIIYILADDLGSVSYTHLTLPTTPYV